MVAVAIISSPTSLPFLVALVITPIQVAVPTPSLHVAAIATLPLRQVPLSVSSLPVADTSPPLIESPPVALAFALAIALPMSDRYWKPLGKRDSTTERSGPTSRSRVELTLRVSRLPINDRWETMLQHIFRDISRILALDVDFDRGTGRMLLAEKHRVAQRAVECSWVVLSGVLFEIVEPFRNPTPRPIFVVLNLPTDSNYYKVITGFVAAARARGVYDVSLDLMDESPLPGKRSWFGFLTVFPRSTSAIMAMDGTTLPGALGPLRLIKVDNPPAFFARDSRDLAKVLEEYRDVIV
ncbi:hypothetical protein GGF31_004757 [Allomyces arbusculus]|nr:hypothetical protein GGF31_004757 [Allomyces arbusculus]